MRNINLLGQLLNIISLLPDEEPYNTFAKDVLQSLSVLCERLVNNEQKQMCKINQPTKKNECFSCTDSDFDAKVSQFIEEIKQEMNQES